ncbi:MAG: NAD(P)/FAD-dependent oxidoreductase [Bacteriovoracia bacterium]
MIRGSLNPKDKNVTIVGAGISGLLSAYYFEKSGFKVSVIEKKPHVGGLIHTLKTPYGIAEQAAHSILVTDGMKELCQTIQVNLLPCATKKRYILRKNKIKIIPLDSIEFLTLLFKATFVKSTDLKSETLDKFCIRHLGTAALEYLLDPFVTGIFACSPNELSVKAAFPAIIPSEGKTLVQHFVKSKKSTKTKRPAMCSVEYGMQDLVDKLYLYLKDKVTFYFDKEIREIPKGNTVLCGEAYSMTKLFKTDSLIAQRLEKIQYAPLVSVTVFCRKEIFRKEVDGVGVLVPSAEAKETLGVLFNSRSFKNRVSDEKYCSFTVMLGGTRKPEAIEYTDEKILTIIKNELSVFFSGHLLDEFEVKHSVISRWKKAIPIYSNLLLDAWKDIDIELSKTPGVMLFGNYTGSVSIRGMQIAAQDLYKNLNNGIPKDTPTLRVYTLSDSDSGSLHAM